MDIEKRIEELLQEIAFLKSENAALKKELLDHNIIPEEKQARVIDPNQGMRILPIRVNADIANHFFSYFWGRMDVYSLRVVSKTAKVGYYPQCNNFWRDGCLKKENRENDKRSGYVCLNCYMCSWKPVNSDVIMKHLLGKMTVGIYPMYANDTCRFLVFDFDNHSNGSAQTDFANHDDEWKQEVDAMRRICTINNIDPLVERSRSGKGAHIWVFFEKPVPASLARNFGDSLLKKGAESVNLKSFSYYDRMMPTQNYLHHGGLGNLIALPLQPEALKRGNSAFVDENWNAYPDQMAILFSKPKLSVEQINRLIQQWTADSVLNIDQTGLLSTAKRDRPWIHYDRWYREDVHGTMQITLSNLIYVDSVNLEPRIQNQIRKLAAFSNPVFYKNQAMNLSNFGQSRYIYLGEDVNGYIAIPRGLMDVLLDQLKEFKIPYHIDDQRRIGKPIHVKFNGTLKDNQKHAANEMLSFDNGILSAATAFGKTVVCCDLMAEKRVSTLIILESSSLIMQWEKAINRFLTVDEEIPEYKTKSGRLRKRKSVVGILQGQKDTTNGIIDIAMAGSVFRKKQTFSRFQDYGMIIVDECHHAASETIQRILRESAAKYVYGASATPVREDGLTKINYMLIGPIRFIFSAKERAAEQGIDHIVIPRFTRTVSLRIGNPKINEAYEIIRDSKNRNNQIVSDTKKCIDENRSPAILTKYKEHAHFLYQQLNGYADHTFLLLGDMPAKEKRYAYQNINEVPADDTMLLIATGKLVGEGFDCPRLDTLIMATPIAGKSVVEQYAGRLNRDCPGKQNVMVYDYIDSHIPVFDRMYGKRLRAYKHIGYHIYQNDSKLGKKNHGFIFDMDSYQETYFQDLINANKEIVISSPELSSRKISKLIQTLKPLQENGVSIIILTWKTNYGIMENNEARMYLLDELRSSGFDLRLVDGLTEHFSIIDKEILWYGSINFLGKEDAEDNVMRVINPEAAEELLESALK